MFKWKHFLNEKIKDLTSGKTSNAHRSKDNIVKVVIHSKYKIKEIPIQIPAAFFFAEIDKTMIFTEIDNRQKSIWIFKRPTIFLKNLKK